jgi:hypothetical protein
LKIAGKPINPPPDSAAFRDGRPQLGILLRNRRARIADYHLRRQPLHNGPIGCARHQPTPATLAGTSATINGVAVPLLYVSPSQIAPGLSTADSSRCGQAAALNVAPDGSLSVNSPANSAAPGDYLVLYGTGLGAFWSPPASGVPCTGQQFNDGPNVAVGQDLDQSWLSGVTDRTQGFGPAWAGLAPISSESIR